MEIRKGCRFRSRRPTPVTCLTSWATPFTGGYDRVLPAGEILVVANDPPAGATAVYCDPARYRALHARMVPWRDRLNLLFYRGYYLCVPIETLRTEFEPVSHSSRIS